LGQHHLAAIRHGFLAPSGGSIFTADHRQSGKSAAQRRKRTATIHL
jgi:hypothetical protein